MRARERKREEQSLFIDQCSSAGTKVVSLKESDPLVSRLLLAAWLRPFLAGQFELKLSRYFQDSIRGGIAAGRKME